MTTRTTPPLAAAVVRWLPVAAVALVVTCAAGVDRLAPEFLLLGVLLVPAGVVVGIVAQVRLAVHRRRARRPGPPSDAETAEARAPVQLVARRFDQVLLVMAAAGALVLALILRLDSVRSSFAAQSPLLTVLDVLQSVEFGLLFTALLAILAVAGLALRRIGLDALQEGEAWALRSGGRAGRRIRLDRIGSWLVLGVYGLLAVAAVVQAVTFSPSF